MTDTLRILIVDDDQIMTKTLVKILRTRGHQAEAAHTGRTTSATLLKKINTSVLKVRSFPINSQKTPPAITDIDPRAGSMNLLTAMTVR